MCVKVKSVKIKINIDQGELTLAKFKKTQTTLADITIEGSGHVCVEKFRCQQLRSYSLLTKVTFVNFFVVYSLPVFHFWLC